MNTLLDTAGGMSINGHETPEVRLDMIVEDFGTAE
jgi:hypothetical protein